MKEQRKQEKVAANGWRGVAPWMFTPTNLPKGKVRSHKLEMS